MTGLDAEKCHLLEVACIITDGQLNVVAKVRRLVHHNIYVVYQLHTCTYRLLYTVSQKYAPDVFSKSHQNCHIINHC